MPGSFESETKVALKVNENFLDLEFRKFYSLFWNNNNTNNNHLEFDRSNAWCMLKFGARDLHHTNYYNPPSRIEV